MPVNKAPCIVRRYERRDSHPKPNQAVIDSSRDGCAGLLRQTGGRGRRSSFFAGRVEIEGAAVIRPALTIQASSQDTALVVRQDGMGDAAHLDGPVRISPSQNSGRPALAIQTPEKFNAVGLSVSSGSEWDTAHFSGRVYMGPPPSTQVTNRRNALYVQNIFDDPALVVHQGNFGNVAAQFFGGVTVEGQLSANGTLLTMSATGYTTITRLLIRPNSYTTSDTLLHR